MSVTAGLGFPLELWTTGIFDWNVLLDWTDQTAIKCFVQDKTEAMGLIYSLNFLVQPVEAICMWEFIYKFSQEGRAKPGFDEVWMSTSGMCYYTLKGGLGVLPRNLDHLRSILTQSNQ